MIKDEVSSALHILLENSPEEASFDFRSKEQKQKDENMKGLATLLLCSCLIGVSLAGKVPSRDRRSVLQFHEMLACASGRPATDFSDYGCYCGLGGFGDPVDSLDRCCQRHDNCYSGLISRGFCPEGTNVYHASYHFTKTDCVTQWSFLSKRDYQLVCESQYNDDCQARMCECDRRAAMCMSAMDYDNSYANYDKNDKC